MAKKKTAKKRKVVAKAMPAESCSTNSSCCSGMLLCKLSVIAAVFFLISVLPAVGNWAMGIHWGIWLIVAVVLGWKPMMKCMKK